MLKPPSTRELINTPPAKTPSPLNQATPNTIRPAAPKDRDTLDTENDMSDPIFLPEPTLSDEPEETEDTDVSNDSAEPNQIDPARISRKLKLLELINTKLEEAQSAKSKSTKPTPSTRAESNRANAQNSTGPRTPEGKQRISANALKTGFFSSVDRLHPQDSPAYLDAVDDLRMGLHPDGPVEEQLIRELAMFRARLLRLESAEYALLCADIETNTGDSREIAVGYINNADALDRLSKAETHLRRAYNRTWDRLERMQKERLKLPFNESLKQSQRWATYEAQRTICPKCSAAEGKKTPQLIPPLHPALDENGNLKKYPAGHPLYRPKDDNENDKNDDLTDPKRRR